MSETVTFNTGREYGPNGQVIVAAANGGVVIFHDITRGIAGHITALYDDRADNLQSFVLSHYDEGEYYDEPRARGLQPGNIGAE